MKRTRSSADGAALLGTTDVISPSAHLCAPAVPLQYIQADQGWRLQASVELGSGIINAAAGRVDPAMAATINGRTGKLKEPGTWGMRSKDQSSPLGGAKRQSTSVAAADLLEQDTNAISCPHPRRTYESIPFQTGMIRAFRPSPVHTALFGAYRPGTLGSGELSLTANGIETSR